MSDPGAESTAPAVDWSAITSTVECPLCLYNLRGLSESRCPECGYKFEWPELLEPGRAKHRYLFEHHPERNFWSFFRTLAGGLRRGIFWTDLKPTQVVRPRRLIIYWVLCTLLMLLLPASEALRVGIELAQENASQRRMTMLGLPSGSSQYTAMVWQNFIDTNYPLPPSRRFFQQYGQLIYQITPGMAIQFGTIAIWPWLTFAALMVFQASMRKAKVQRAHVLRCVIYSSDASIWCMLLSVVVLLAVTLLIRLNNASRDLENFAFWLVVLLWVLRIDRLTVAYRKYLRFDHPFLTALASQIIVLLAMGGILFWGMRLLVWIIRA